MVFSRRALQTPDRWHAPIHALCWFVFAGTSLVLGLYFTAPSPDWAPMMFAGATSTAPLAAAANAAFHVPMPEEVRGIYMTAAKAASKTQRADLFAYVERNRLNAIVIDVKDDNGRLAFMPQRASLQSAAPEEATIKDLDAVLREAGERGLYRIARVFVFQDPSFVARFPAEAVQKTSGGVWSDYKGVTWVDAASKAAWRYNAEVAREAYARGFDEIQFDYIRFPSDGHMQSIVYARHDESRPKHEVLRDFFRFMHEQLEEKEGIPVSYDLFGYVTWYIDYDLGIGQLLADALPHGTAISAMVYPSHYGAGTLGYENPAEHPYEIVADSLRKANRLYAMRDQECAALASGEKSATSTFLLPCGVPLAHHRPWLQAFDIGAVYDAEKIRAQISATRDQGGKGYLLWNARNVYRDFNLAATSSPAL
ncbi:MAG: putative glycoside hydrolase [Patescibacteria group bacterium]|nr:MAG: putative glycoside hydrolase [Patescibacteria group bacterium]